jgi:hypothetical protein
MGPRDISAAWSHFTLREAAAAPSRKLQQRSKRGRGAQAEASQGAVAASSSASILRKAAGLKPIEALRYE